MFTATPARAGGPDGAGDTFTIDRFDVRGNHLLSDAEVQRLVATDAGSSRRVSDISRAITSLQAAYRERGYAAVRVTAPEQELPGGVVRIDVQENRLGKVTVKANLLYALGASLDLLYGRSSVNVPGASPTLGGVLGFTGKGQVFGLHANLYSPRDGETTRELVVGIDRKETASSFDIAGVAVDVEAPTQVGTYATQIQDSARRTVKVSGVSRLPGVR